LHAACLTSNPTGEFELERVHAGGALVDKDKLDSLQAKLFRSQLSMEPPPAGLLQRIIDDVLAALDTAAAGDAGRGVTAGARGGEEEAEGVAEARRCNDKGSGVSWDRVRDPAYLMRVVTVRAPPTLLRILSSRIC